MESVADPPMSILVTLVVLDGSGTELVLPLILFLLGYPLQKKPKSGPDRVIFLSPVLVLLHVI